MSLAAEWCVTLLALSVCPLPDWLNNFLEKRTAASDLVPMTSSPGRRKRRRRRMRKRKRRRRTTTCVGLHL